jgi:hypothetical protein
MAVHLTTYRGIYYLHVERFLALYALMGFFGFAGATGVLPASVSDFMVWDGGLPYREVSSIPEAIAKPETGFFFLVF